MGPSHISTLFQSIPSYWAPMKQQLVQRVGDVENDQELNERISPFYHADKIKVPLLIGQGANDPRVKQAEADQIFNAMRVSSASCFQNPSWIERQTLASACGSLLSKCEFWTAVRPAVAGDRFMILAGVRTRLWAAYCFCTMVAVLLQCYVP